MNNQYISMADVKKRKTMLEQSDAKYSLPRKTTSRLDHVYEQAMESPKFLRSNIDYCLREWADLGTTSAGSFEHVLNLFDNICDKCFNKGYITQVANDICENVIPKVRTGSETQGYIKHKLGRFKTPVSTKISNAVDKMSNTAKDSFNPDAPSMATGKGSKPTNEEIQKECYERFLEAFDTNRACDRVLDNYNKVSKRFNIDNVLKESTDVDDFIHTYTSLIDTYDMSNKNKVIIASETAQFTLESSHISYERTKILEGITDYFLFREDCDVCSIKAALDAARFYKPEDMVGLQYITELDPNDETKYVRTLGENSYEFPDVDAMIYEFSATETAKDVINKFKTAKDKTVEGFKNVIKRIYTKSEDQICNEVPNVLSIIRVVFVVGGTFAINPVVGLVALIVDQSISHGLKQKETKKIIKDLNAELKKAQDKKDKLNDKDEIARTEEYIKALKSNIEKMETYLNKLLSDREQDEYLEDKYKDSDSSSSDDDDDEFKFDFDFSFDESAVDAEVIWEMTFGNTLNLAIETMKKGIMKLSDKQKAASRTIEIQMNNFKKSSERAMREGNREAVIKGSVLPSAGNMLKAGLVAGLTAATGHPILATIGMLGYLGCYKKSTAKERQMILDEIEIELKMVDRYLKIAEEQNDLEAQKQLMKTQRELERQHQRIKYKMKVKFNQETGDKYKNTSNDD